MIRYIASLVIIWLTVLLGAALWSEHFDKPKLLHPSQFETTSQVLASNRANREVIGFLPYWNLKSLPDIPFDHLTTIYYFALDVDGEGNFNKSDNGWINLHGQEFANLQSQFDQHPNIRRGVTIVSLNADNIARVINSQARGQLLVKNTLALMKTYHFQDLNFDFEYYGTFGSTEQKNYTALVQNLATSVHQEIPDSRVTIDTYADSVAKPRIFDIAILGKITDQVIIMGYDFHRLGSLNAGPIAPLFGKEKYEYEIFQSVVDYLKKMPADKLVLAVPFYGYEWPTLDPEPNSPVAPSSRGPEISSYKRSLETAKDYNATINFDDESKSAWFTYFDKGSGTFRQVWFENERSLGLKFDLVNQAGLAGAAIWALGYDGTNNTSLWQTVKDKLL